MDLYGLSRGPLASSERCRISSLFDLFRGLSFDAGKKDGGGEEMHGKESVNGCHRTGGARRNLDDGQHFSLALKLTSLFSFRTDSHSSPDGAAYTSRDRAQTRFPVPTAAWIVGRQRCGIA